MSAGNEKFSDLEDRDRYKSKPCIRSDGSSDVGDRNEGLIDAIGSKTESSDKILTKFSYRAPTTCVTCANPEDITSSR